MHILYFKYVLSEVFSSFLVDAYAHNIRMRLTLFLQKTLPVQSTFILHLHTFSFFAPCYVTVLLSGSSTYISDFTHCFLFFYFLRIEKCSEVKEGKMLDCYC